MVNLKSKIKMAIASITQWLSSAERNYQHGKALYLQYGDDALVLAIINSGSGNFHLNKLTEGLEKLNLKVNLQPKQLVFAQQPIAESKATPNLEAAPSVIWDVRHEKNLKFAQARKLHESIRFMDNADHRLDAALQLLDLMDFVNKSWLIIDEWAETGKVLERQLQEAEATVNELTIAELVAERTNLSTYISKAKKRANALTDQKKKPKAIARVEKLTQRFEEVKRRLNELV